MSREVLTTQSLTLPEWALKLLASCPKAGNGVHKWLFIVALKLHRYFPDKNELVWLLRCATSECGRPVDDTEIENAVLDSLRVIENPSGEISNLTGGRKGTRNLSRQSRLMDLASRNWVNCRRSSAMTTRVTRKNSLTHCFQATPCCASRRVKKIRTRSRESYGAGNLRSSNSLSRIQ